MTVHTISLVKALVDNGCEVIVTAFQHDYFTEALADTSAQVINLPLADRPGRPGLKLAAWLRSIPRDPACSGILCRGVGGGSSLPFLFGLATKCRRLYAIEHGMADLPYVAWGQPAPAKTVRRRLINWIGARLVYKSISVSEATRVSVVRVFDFPPRKTVTCHNWIDIDRFKPDARARAELRRSLGVADEGLLIGYVGRLAREKRVDLLIKGFAAFRKQSLRSVKLAVLGTGPLSKELDALCGELGVRSDVYLTGWVADTRPWHQALDVAVLASFAEPFGLGLMESMACGAICLGTPNGGVKEFVRDGVNGFLAPLDSEDDIARALFKIASLSEEETDALRKAARDTVVTEFSPSVRLSALMRALDAPKNALMSPALPAQ